MQKSSGSTLVSSSFRDFIEEWDPGHSFYIPVILYWRDGEIIEDQYFWHKFKDFIPDAFVMEESDVRPVHKTSPDDTVRDACIIMSAANVGALPVVNEGGELVGIISERDVIRRSIIVYRPAEETPVKQMMTLNPQWLSPDAKPTEAVQIMTNGRFRHLPICEEGQVLGMVSIRDFNPQDTLIVKQPHRTATKPLPSRFQRSSS
jgi:CBS domain-containing protein